MIVFLAPGAGDAAFVASRRLGGAVVRNRARRVLREAWRRVPREGSTGFDAVFVARKGMRGAKAQDLAEEMEALVRKAMVRWAG